MTSQCCIRKSQRSISFSLERATWNGEADNLPALPSLTPASTQSTLTELKERKSCYPSSLHSNLDAYLAAAIVPTLWEGLIDGWVMALIKDRNFASAFDRKRLLCSSAALLPAYRLPLCWVASPAYILFPFSAPVRSFLQSSLAVVPALSSPCSFSCPSHSIPPTQHTTTRAMSSAISRHCSC